MTGQNFDLACTESFLLNNVLRLFVATRALNIPLLLLRDFFFLYSDNVLNLYTYSGDKSTYRNLSYFFSNHASNSVLNYLTEGLIYVSIILHFKSQKDRLLNAK